MDDDSGDPRTARRQDLETIFEAFEQVGDVRLRDVGTGLGLAISQRLVQLMGGEIATASQPGAGSRFWFELRLPLAAAGEALRPLGAAIVGYAGRRRRVLVVDDMAANRAFLADFLGGLGFSIVEATDGGQALALAGTAAPDLVLMDLVMPVMGGLEAIRCLRATPGLERLAIIAVSASTGPTGHGQVQDWGADRFLPKPIDLDQLLAAIGDLLKLEWEHPAAPPLAAESIESAAPLTLPPREALEALHRLALTGNMRDIRQWATRLQSGDERYQPFADQLRVLAAGYQSRTILNLVKRYLETEGQ